jgi:hypothetical protein
MLIRVTNVPFIHSFIIIQIELKNKETCEQFQRLCKKEFGSRTKLHTYKKWQNAHN